MMASPPKCSFSSHCDRVLRSHQDYLTLSCGCIVCPECALVCTINRKLNNFRCDNPRCKTLVDSFTYHKPEENQKRAYHITQFEPDQNRDPVRFIERQNRTFREAERKVSPYAILLLAHSDYGSQKVEEDDAIVTVSSVFNMNTGPNTQKDFQALVAIFAVLHTPVS
jgi:Na+-translocating ferredoxin:NAD+ oxidoreductase RnfC subunit